MEGIKGFCFLFILLASRTHVELAVYSQTDEKREQQKSPTK